MAPAGKQKPNDACACGSGGKFKKCCGAANSAANAAAAAAPRARPAGAPVPLSPAGRVQLKNDIQRAYAEAQAADEAADLARATRRCVTGLALVADAWSDGAGAASIVQQTVLFLHLLVELYSRQNRLSQAEDAHARAERLLERPSRLFWVRALTTVTFAAWREDEPMPPVDSRCIVPLESALARENEELLHRLHTNLGLAYSRAGGRMPQAIAAYEAALSALLARVPPSPDRDVSAAALHENIGNQYITNSELEAGAACYEKASRLLARGGGDAAVALRRKGLQTHLAMNLAALEAVTQPGPGLGHASDADLASFEDSWVLCEKHRDGAMSGQWDDVEGTPASTCRSALGRCSTEAQRQRWLLRACSLPGVQAAARGAAGRACRHCAAPCEAEGGDKLKRCAGCSRVAFCSPRCQKADWARHKAACGAAAATPEAVLADAVCVGCNAPLLGPPHGGGQHAPLTGDGQVFLLRCLHLLHAGCGGPPGSHECMCCVLSATATS